VDGLYVVLPNSGEWDRTGTIVKNKSRQEQLRNTDRRLQNFLQEVLTTRATSSYPNVGGREKAEVFRKFWHIGVNDVNRQKKWECSTIEGMRQLHFVSSLFVADSTKLMCRDFSCFCMPCVMRDWEACENKEHIKKWRLVVIQTAFPRDVRLQMGEFEDGADSQYGEDRNALVDLLCIGDTFIVPADQPNPENVEFYLLICRRPKFLILEAFTCRWDPEFKVGDYIVVGTYYQAWGKDFVLLGSSRPAYLQAELIVQIKFRMEPQDHRIASDDTIFYLSADDQSSIEAEYRRR
jgi:hypothetical protein